VASGADGTVAIIVTIGGGTISGSGLFAFVPGQGLQKVAVVGELDSTGGAITAVSFSPIQRESLISTSGQLLFSSGNVVLLGTPGATPVRIAAVGTVTEGGGSITGSMTPLAVNANGQVLFRANSRMGLESASGVPRYFIGGVGTTPVSILTVGAAAPGGGSLTTITTTPSFNATGHMAFKAVLDGGSTSGIYVVAPTGEITLVARNGGGAPSGQVFSMTGSHPDVLLNDAGDVVFRSDVTGGSADSGYFVRRGLTGPVQTLVLQGQPAPGTSGTFATFGPGPNGFMGEHFQLAAAGDVSVRGTVVGDPVSSGGYWHIAPDLTSTPIVVQGLSRPGLNGALVTVFANTPSWVSGGRLAMWMRVTGAAYSEGFALFVPAPAVVAPAPQSVLAGAPATFAVTATSARTLTYRWQMSVDGGTTFTDVPDGAPFTGATSATLTVSPTTGAMNQSRFRCVVADGPSTTTSAGAVLTVEAAPAIVGTPARLRFSATKNGAAGELISVTGSQMVTVTFAGSPSPQWTATSDQPWAVVTNGVGTGAGTFSVSITNPGNVIGGAASLSATITLAAANVGTSTSVAVELTVAQEAGTTTGPIGQVDTPAQDTTGVQGAIAMTGWVVDDVGVAHVRIYRQCLSFESAPPPSPAAAPCQDVLGQRVVFVGEASVVAGARPDLELAYPTLPASNSAGWGSLILSNLLPNIPAESATGGGVGRFTLYAVATDKEGNQTVLGRTINDATPTAVTVANDTIAKPFGSIDTPGQGATVSGTLHNFGWVLTPDPSPSTPVLVPTDGSSVRVFIDGALVGTALYNLCRGSVAVDGLAPPGLLCDDDVSTIFRGNGTLYRNLDAGRGPIGLRSINTTSLSNGLHTIQWGVTDSAGRGEGIGSRYFNVLNSAAAKAACSAECEVRSAEDATFAAADLGLAPVADIVVYGRTGFNERRAFVPVEAVDGVPTIVVPELGRVELQVPGAMHVSLFANGTLRDAPVGTSVDEEAGMVRWSVGPGYLGTYRLSVEREHDHALIDVVVAPMALVEEPVRMHLDRADVHGAVFTLHGWALDPQADTGSGIGAVHVWGQSRSAECAVRSAECGPIFLGTADLGVPRPDVAAAHGARFPNAGFSFQGVLGDGDWEVTAYIWNYRTGRFEDARSVRVGVR